MFTENLAQLWTHSSLMSDARSALPHAPQVAEPAPSLARTRRHMADLLDGAAEALHAAAARTAPAAAPANDFC